MSQIHRLTHGLSFLLRGTQLLWTDRSLRKWAIIPFFIDLVLLIFGLSIGFGNISIWAGKALAFLFPDPTGFLYALVYYPLLFLFWIGFLVVLVYGIFLLATVVASPFNSLLAERVLIKMGALPDRPFEMARWIRVSVRMLLISLIRAVIFAFVGIFIFLGSLIPVVNVAASFAALMIIAFDSADYSLEAMEMSLKDRFEFFRSHFSEFSGMAGVLGVTLLLPGLTLLLLPSSVAGAAQIIAESKGRSR